MDLKSKVFRMVIFILWGFLLGVPTGIVLAYNYL